MKVSPRNTAEKTRKRQLGKDPLSNYKMVETIADENPSLPERDFEDITEKLEIRMPKRLRDSEHPRREILRLRNKCLQRLTTCQTLR